VLPLIEDRLGGLELPIYVYADYRPGKAAQEPGLPAVKAPAAG
jgi:hypothetical protein